MQLSPTTAESIVLAVKRRKLLHLPILLLLGFFATQAFAQEATILGTVTDPSGAAVPNATVTLTNTDTGVARTATTNSDGTYVAPNLHIGHYTARVDATGFKRVDQSNILLQVGDRTRLDFKLEIGSAQEQVTVEAAAVGVQTDSGEVSNVITGKQVANLATNGRSMYTLVNLTTGASNLQGDFQTPTPVGGDAGVSFNGQRVGGNLYMIDGGEDLDRGSAGNMSVMPSLESIAEFRQLDSNYSAEYGLSAGATMTTVLKSGTKTLHASAWEYNRNNALDARNYFNPAPNKVAKLNFNTYGFNVGGQVPWGKSHPTFFFYNMEWRKLRQGGNYNQTVPLPSEYGGNFAGASSVPYAPCAANLSAAQQARFAAAGVALSTCDASGNVTTKSFFPGNQIPTSLLDPNAQTMLAAGIFPAPTNGTQFQGTPVTPTDVREEIVRIDHEFNSKNSIFAHYIAEQISQGFGTTMWSGDNVPTIGNTFGNPSYSGVLHYTEIINPRLLNEIAFNYNGNRIHITPVGVFSAPSSFAFNRVFTGPNVDNRFPSINLSGSTGTNYTVNWMPWNNQADSYQWMDNVSWTKGTHQLRMGGSVLLYRKIQDLFAPTQGSFSFNGRYTGNDFADFLLGYANNYSENAVQDTGHWNFNAYSAYAQDNWRATNRLTLNLGLRWDGLPHTYEANGRESNFYPNLYNPANAAVLLPNGNISPTSPGLGTSPNPILAGYQFYLNGIGIAGQGGIPKSLVDNHWANFGPRLGFAYDVTGHGTTVVRGGFGMMYTSIQGNDMYNAGPNQPFSASTSFNNVSLSNPQMNVQTGAINNTVPIVVGNITGLNSNMYKMPYSMQYSAGVQRSLNTRTVLSVMYVGTQTRHMSDYQEWELPNPSLLPGLVASNSSTVYNQNVPYIGYHSLRMAQNEASGHYNSLQANVSGQVTKDLQLSAGYTLARAIDSFNTGNSAGDLSNVSNPYAGWRYDVGPSYFDRTNVAFVNWVYDMPFFRNASSHLVRTVAGGWQISGIVNIMSGAPLNMTYNGQSVCSVVPNCQNRPDLVGNLNNPHTVTEWFNTAALAAPAPGTWGTLQHGAIRGPGRDNWNMSLFKSFIISAERGSQFQFRADAFNVWNHTQFRGDMNGGISTNLGASNFGQVTSAFDPRVFQLGAKLVF
ncbi:MAG TPA: TonB-dependent receptor [Terriglobales bacterium]|nr:TonB-dependent receptor [Terriglobales bacterium]